MITCTDCVHKNRCWERSRNYPCTEFKLKEKYENQANRGDEDKTGTAADK